jgi:hypothetical protein
MRRDRALLSLLVLVLQQHKQQQRRQERWWVELHTLPEEVLRHTLATVRRLWREARLMVVERHLVEAQVNQRLMVEKAKVVKQELRHIVVRQ